MGEFLVSITTCFMAGEMFLGVARQVEMKCKKCSVVEVYAGLGVQSQGWQWSLGFHSSHGTYISYFSQTLFPSIVLECECIY